MGTAVVLGVVGIVGVVIVAIVAIAKNHPIRAKFNRRGLEIDSKNPEDDSDG